MASDAMTMDRVRRLPTERRAEVQEWVVAQGMGNAVALGAWDAATSTVFVEEREPGVREVSARTVRVSSPPPWLEWDDR